MAKRVMRSPQWRLSAPLVSSQPVALIFAPAFGTRPQDEGYRQRTVRKVAGGRGGGEGTMSVHTAIPQPQPLLSHGPSCDPLPRCLSSPRGRDALEEAREKTRKARTTTAGDAGPWAEPCTQQSLSSRWKALTSGHRALLGAHCPQPASGRDGGGCTGCPGLGGSAQDRPPALQTQPPSTQVNGFAASRLAVHLVRPIPGPALRGRGPWLQ